MSSNAERVTSESPTLLVRGRALRAIVASGLTAGVLDILYAFVIWGMRGVSPIRIGQSISAGLLGVKAAVAGGVATGLLGLVLHFFMALIIAAIYCTAASRMPLLVKRPAACGIAYGLVVYGVMNYVVVPLSAIGQAPHPPLYIMLTGIAVHMFFIGLPIALFTRRAYVTLMPRVGGQISDAR